MNLNIQVKHNPRFVSTGSMIANSITVSRVRGSITNHIYNTQT